MAKYLTDKKTIARIKASKIHQQALALLSEDWKRLKYLRGDVEKFYNDAYHIMQDLVFAGLADVKSTPSTIRSGKGYGSIFFFKLGDGESTACPCLGMLINIPGYGGRFVKGYKFPKWIA